MQGSMDVETNHLTNSQALLQLSNPLNPSGHHQMSGLGNENNGIVGLQDQMQNNLQEGKRSRDESLFEEQIPHTQLLDGQDKDLTQGSAKRKKSAKAGRKLRSPTKHFTKEEDDEIIHLQTLYDNDWGQILKHSRLLQNNGRHVESIAHHVRYLSNRGKEKQDEKDKKKEKNPLDPNTAMYHLEGNAEALQSGSLLSDNFLSEGGQYASLDTNFNPNHIQPNQNNSTSNGNSMVPALTPLTTKKKRVEELVHPTAERRILEQVRLLKETVTKVKKELKQERKDRKAAQESFDKLVETTQNIERVLSIMYHAAAPSQSSDNQQQRTT